MTDVDQCRMMGGLGKVVEVDNTVDVSVVLFSFLFTVKIITELSNSNFQMFQHPVQKSRRKNDNSYSRIACWEMVMPGELQNHHCTEL